LPLQNSLNVVILNDLKYGLRTFFKYKNSIYPQQIKYFLRFFISKKKVEQYYKKSKNLLLQIIDKQNIYYYVKIICVSEIFVKFLIFFFKYLGIERIYMIDDTRYCIEFQEAAKSLRIKTYGYQQGRVNEYHVGISQICFDNYAIWSNYSKKKIIKLNRNYINKNLFIIGHPLVDSNFKIKTNKIGLSSR
jgi:hypothetical protein